MKFFFKAFQARNVSLQLLPPFGVYSGHKNLFHSRIIYWSIFTFLFCLPAVIATDEYLSKPCVIHRDPALPGNFYNDTKVRSDFLKIYEQCRKLNFKRLRIANASVKSPNALRCPQVNLGIQLSTEPPNCFGEVLPAIDIAIGSIASLGAFSGITFNVVPIIYLDWLACDALAILEQFDKDTVHVLFGPINDFALGTTARFSTAMYSIPVVSPAAPATTLADKYEFGMLTRMYFTHADVKWVLDTTFAKFGWERNTNTPIALLAESQGSTAKGSNSSWEQVFLKQAVSSFLKSFKTLPIELKPEKVTWPRVLLDLKRSARIVILCADPGAVRTLMLIAHDIGFINGEYVFFNIDLLSSSKQQATPWYKEGAPDEENRKAREAYRVLMTVTLRKPDSAAYHKFADEVKKRALEDYNYSYVSNEINPYIGAFHDAVLLYAHALNDTLASNGSIWNGTLLTENMRNRTFEGIAGHVSVDSNGDRNADYSLLDMDPETGRFEVVANFFGNAKVYVPVKNKEIDWANEENQPPPDTPPCGFDGTKCRRNNIIRIGVATAVIILVLFISVIVGGVIIYKKAKFAAELKAMNWIIPWDALRSSSGRNRNYRHSSIGLSSNHPDNKSNDDREVLFTVDSPIVKNGDDGKPIEQQFLLDDIATSPSKFIPPRDNSTVAFTPTVTFEPSKSPDRVSRKKKKKKFSVVMEHLFKPNPTAEIAPMGKPDKSVGASPLGDSAPEWAESNNHSGTTPTWLAKRQQRWSRKSEAPSHDTLDSNSGTSGGWSSAFWSGNSKRNIGDMAVGHKRRLSKRHRLSEAKPRRKKSSLAWDNAFSAHKMRSTESFDSLESFSSLDTISGVRLDFNANIQMFTATTIYKGNVVALKPLHDRGRIDLTKELLIEVKRVKDLNYDHICRFVGACIDPPHLVYEYCPKGSLQDVLENEQIKLEWMVKFSLMQDICRGMIYLHHNLGAHGKLKSSNCLVDARFNLKITDFGLHLLRGTKELTEDTYAHFRNKLWTAPELLRNQAAAVYGTFKGDVYSFAIVCQEIVYRRGVFYIRNDNPEPKTVVEHVAEANPIVPYRPTLELSEGCTEELVNLITKAWSEDPQMRPDFTTIKVSMRKLNKGGDTGNILENLLTRMEQYATNLEECVAQRTQQYLEEKRKAEDLLYSMLPRSVATQLIVKQSVTAENFEMVTIYFSDIVEFTSLAADSTAMQVVELLNRLYTMFDKIIEGFDVYKVETIGDAYVVASGLPQRNENRHAREIARMSIEFLSAIFKFKIPHRPDKKLQLRIGVHSGPVVAGVVGSKMPRYCLFGDTVNTSSRMESNGYPLKIHISHQTMNILRFFGTFIMSERGLVEMKGKGAQRTYWLHGEGSKIVDPIPAGATIMDCQVRNVVPPNNSPEQNFHGDAGRPLPLPLNRSPPEHLPAPPPSPPPNPSPNTNQTSVKAS